jgi:hypothetical protein
LQTLDPVLDLTRPSDAKLTNFTHIVVMRSTTGLHIVVTDFDYTYFAVLGRSTLIQLEAEACVGFGPLQHNFFDGWICGNDLVGVIFDLIEVVAG